MVEELTFLEHITKASEEATLAASKLPFGKHRSIVHAAVAFVEASKNPQEDQIYIESIYRAMINLQHCVIMGAETDTANKALQQLLYCPARGNEAGWLSPGMKTANEFTKQVIAAAETARDTYVGTSIKR